MNQAQIDALLAAVGLQISALPSNPDSATFLANNATEAQAQCAALNANLTTIYQTQFSNWAGQVAAGKIPAANPPQPPPAFTVATASNGLSWPLQLPGAAPVTPMPPIPQVPQPSTAMVIGIGNHDSGNYWNATPQNANVPNGYQTPGESADGVVGIWQWTAFPFGGWWLKIG